MRRAAAGLLAWLVLSCATTRPHVPVPADYPEAPAGPIAKTHDFLRVQSIVAASHGHQQSLQAVLQKVGDKLTLIGMTPFGAKAFVLEQSGSTIHFTPFLMKDLPFPPEFMLNDIQRTYFRGLNEGVLSDGWHEAERGGEHIRESWEGGRLLERQYERLDGKPPGKIAITYVGGMANEHAPETIEIDNGWLGYHLTIGTVSEQALP